MSTLIYLLIPVVIPLINSQYTYQSLTLQKYVNYITNPYVSAHVSGTTESDDVLLIFHSVVERTDNYQIFVRFLNDKGIELPEMRTTNNLCDQLDIENNNRRLFSHGNMFGLNGLHCPIAKGNVQNNNIGVNPFNWPGQHIFTTEINCGIYDYQVTLSKCDDLGHDCELLITTGMQLYFSADHCTNHTEIVEDKLDIVQYTDDSPIS